MENRTASEMEQAHTLSYAGENKALKL